jgi:hypothetical protein
MRESWFGTLLANSSELIAVLDDQAVGVNLSETDFSLI